MSSFCVDTTSRKLSNSGRSQRLFNTLARPPAHFPEIGLEPGGFLEDRDQRGLAGARGVEMGEEVTATYVKSSAVILERSSVLAP
jgi:hypothetical protein